MAAFVFRFSDAGLVRLAGAALRIAPNQRTRKPALRKNQVLAPRHMFKPFP
jgi:hypothetical protein